MVLEAVLAGLRAVVGMALVAFLPGYLWSRVVWGDLDVEARVFYSIVLSLSLVTVAVYGANVTLGMPITLETSLLVVLVLSVGAVLLLLDPGIRERTQGPGHQP